MIFPDVLHHIVKRYNSVQRMNQIIINTKFTRDMFDDEDFSFGTSVTKKFIINYFNNEYGNIYTCIYYPSNYDETFIVKLDNFIRNRTICEKIKQRLNKNNHTNYSINFQIELYRKNKYFHSVTINDYLYIYDTPEINKKFHDNMEIKIYKNQHMSKLKIKTNEFERNRFDNINEMESTKLDIFHEEYKYFSTIYVKNIIHEIISSVFECNIGIEYKCISRNDYDDYDLY